MFFSGETGLLVAKITKRAPFTGYANNAQQTEKKRLADVFEKGDLYFNSGDLLKMDKEGFIYFQDRIGDTFRSAEPSCLSFQLCCLQCRCRSHGEQSTGSAKLSKPLRCEIRYSFDMYMRGESRVCFQIHYMVLRAASKRKL